MILKKHKKTAAVIIIVIIVLALLASFLYAVRTKKILLNQYLISGSALKGVDISEYQADVDMDLLAAQGISFVIIRATSGSSFADERFAENWENAGECGILKGAYHFFSFESGGDTQAAHYIKTVGDLSGSMIPAVDVEFYGGEEAYPPEKEAVVRELKIFLDALEEEYHVKPLIYSHKDFYNKYLAGTFDEYPRWIRNVYYPVSLENGNSWYIWQYCDRGRLEGYSGGEIYIDLDVMNNSIAPEQFLVP